MQIKKQACGAYATNCYILNIDDKDYIIDPGENALSFIKKEAKNPVAIGLCTEKDLEKAIAVSKAPTRRKSK